MDTEKEPCSRRQFLVQLAAGAGVLAAAGTVGCAAVATYSANLSGDRILLDRSQLDLKMGEKNAVLVRASGLADAIVLLRDDKGIFSALNARCTHLGCEVRPGGKFLTCPCHQSTFDLQGKVMRGPAQKSLATYPVELRGDKIEIVIGQTSS
jgi:Rieske Fe-S protein